MSTLSSQQYNVQPWLTPVRLVATTNQIAAYNNGPLNNGVGATLTYPNGVLVIDGVQVNLNDRLLLASQASGGSAYTNGLYVCTQAGAVGVSAVLQRSADLQCIEQFGHGFYASVEAGVENAGAIFVLCEPYPLQLGVSAIVFNNTSLSSGASFTKVFTLTAAMLAGAQEVLVQAVTSSTASYLVNDIKVLPSTGLSGGSGNRLLVLTNNFYTFNNAGITAALLGTPVMTLWGGTGNPISATSPISGSGASIFWGYSGGTTDYTAGSVQVAVQLTQLTN